MIPRCFILFGMSTLLCTIAVVTTEGEKQVGQHGKGDTGGEEIEREEALPIDSATLVSRLIASLFIGAAKNCLDEAVNRCVEEFRNPGTTLRCGREFLKQNSERCTTG